MEGLDGFFTRYYNSEADAVRAAIELCIRYGQTNNLTVDYDTVFASTHTRYKYLVCEIISTEKKSCIATMTFEWKERKTTIDRQLPDGTAKTGVFKTPVLKLVHCRLKH